MTELTFLEEFRAYRAERPSDERTVVLVRDPVRALVIRLLLVSEPGVAEVHHAALLPPGEHVYLMPEQPIWGAGT